jgi:hypothetical protein
VFLNQQARADFGSLGGTAASIIYWGIRAIYMLIDWDFDGKIKSERTKAMAALAPGRPRPDLEAHRKATSGSFEHVVAELVSIIGRKLTAYIASIKDVRAIDRWVQKASPQKDVEQRLRFAYHVASMIADFDSPAVVQAWLLGLNPELDDEVPIRLLREGDLSTDGKRVLNAARAFVAGG